ncbi:hypothetical protein ABZ804_21875 [Streptomyces sp. NPDC047726]|uniref:hypothetical protein n=1 Tax=Streptomyces sp. NPDC047726 TaxID=3156651 RepID=UPI0033D6CA71
MAQNPTRTYLVTNTASAVDGRRITFRHSAPAGAVVSIRVDGHPARALLTDTLLTGGRYAAELERRYL